MGLESSMRFLFGLTSEDAGREKEKETKNPLGSK